MTILLVACDKNDANRIVEQVKAINPDTIFSSKIECTDSGVCGLEVLSKSNDLIIKDVSLNRGNCQILDFKTFLDNNNLLKDSSISENIIKELNNKHIFVDYKDKQLGFGDTVAVWGSCQIVEVNLSTNKGDFTQTFK